MKRLLRVIEYVGDDEWIDECVSRRGLQGIVNMPRGVMREVICEVTNAPLNRDAAIEDFRDHTLEKTCNHDPIDFNKGPGYFRSKKEVGSVSR